MLKNQISFSRPDDKDDTYPLPPNKKAFPLAAHTADRYRPPGILVGDSIALVPYTPKLFVSEEPFNHVQYKLDILKHQRSFKEPAVNIDPYPVPPNKKTSPLESVHKADAALDPGRFDTDAIPIEP
jgi:hypothetical protein